MEINRAFICQKLPSVNLNTKFGLIKCSLVSFNNQQEHFHKQRVPKIKTNSLKPFHNFKIGYKNKNEQLVCLNKLKKI
jgi:hypothetical protein